ncbi:DUF5995 family protein [Chloroflexus aurantiacus]
MLTQRMTALVEQWTAVSDRRSIFLACYQRMTENMLSAVARHDFFDPDWVAHLIGSFADYYFAALAAWERDQSGPAVWQYTFTYANRQNASVAQHLLLGVNAHINYDLVLVLDDLLHQEWPLLSAEQQRQRHADYLAVNRVIEQTIDRVQDEVIAPYSATLQLLDAVCGPFDEWCTARLIRNWRNDVWRQALAVMSLNDQEEHLAARHQVDQLALARAYLLSGNLTEVRSFGYPLRWLKRLRLL